MTTTTNKDIKQLKSLTADSGLMIIKDTDLNNFKNINTPDYFLCLTDIGFYHNSKTNKYELKDKTIAIIVNGDELCDKYNADAFIKKHFKKMREFKYLVSLVN